MKLSVILVNWNTCHLLERCLGSIYAFPPDDPFEVIVVDNASLDGSAAMVQHCFPQANLIDSPDNLGFAGGNNLGIRQSSGSYLLLLNPDTEVGPSSLQSLVQFMDEHPGVGASGAQLLYPDGSLQPSCSPFPTLLREVTRMFHLPGVRSDGYYPMETWDPEKPHKVEVIQGACLILRRESLDQIGLLSEDYFMYSEEVDLCYRLRKAGWSLYWVPQSRVVHFGAQSTRQVAGEMFLHLYQGKILYFRKYHSWSTVFVYKVILFLAALSRQALMPIALLETEPNRDKHLTLSYYYRLLLSTLLQM